MFADFRIPCVWKLRFKWALIREWRLFDTKALKGASKNVGAYSRKYGILFTYVIC